MKVEGINVNRSIGIKDKQISNKSGFSDSFMKSYKSATKEELEVLAQQNFGIKITKVLESEELISTLN